MSNSTDTELPQEWQDVSIVGICLDSLGVAGCSLMILYIIVYRQYQSTKDRIIAAIGVTSTAFLAMGSIPERVYYMKHSRLSPLPFGYILMTYSWWWLLLIIETCLLAYSLYVIKHVRWAKGAQSGAILRPLNVTLTAEVGVLLLALAVSFGVGVVSALEYRDHCRAPHVDSEGRSHNGITSDNCVRHYNTINWAWISFLAVPTLVQLSLWRNVAVTNREIAAYTAMDELERSSGMAMALERVIANIVRPLQWYPFIFLFFAVLYIVWVVTLYGADRNQLWAHQVGPVTSMCFSLKGLSVAFVFFSTQTRESNDLPFGQQILHFCGLGGRRTRYRGFSSSLDEGLMDGGPFRGQQSSSGPNTTTLYGEASEQDLFATGSSAGSARTRYDSAASYISYPE
eukprot:CAMPEP_0182937018 /NCGR_PEP_ID=MMETSP0105_2-20130417/41220_1 /TAXON_ID=81532 ORGANISM="Acanthoeca-like sp., Strain 10tr" /NCGR_SAMPLE_ID=MMETSP0105_2 /ASSEMBLY_ACC=CAM_ASM_000205 /LENGTH=398 /DNA_ID=CAMNT_0025076177 /DNA_START=256 /DNA_END=1449 /DNA_ORIENTATION=+